MELFTISVTFILGFVLLIKGADFLVDGAASTARTLGISSLIIGLTVVAFGTSAPELVVNLFAAVQGNTELAIGNVLGSNIANILLILGVAALIYPMNIKESLIWKEVPFSLLAVIALFLMANDQIIDGSLSSQLSRSDGLVMICFFTLFIAYLLNAAKEGFMDQGLDHEHVESRPVWLSMSMIITGLIGLSLGGKWIVDGALFWGTYFGFSQAFMGLTVLAFGTSLPELATAVVAAKKGHHDIIMGNVIGSNIFNILFVLAITSIIRPLNFTLALNQDITVMIVTTFLLFIVVLQNGKHALKRTHGGLFVGFYVIYIIYLIYRG